MTQYMVEFFLFGQKFTKYIEAESHEKAKEIANETPVLEILGSITAGEAAEMINFTIQKDKK